LTLREKIAQLIFVRIGSNLPPVRRVEDDEERVARLLEKCPIAGLLLFNGGPETTAALARLQAVSRSPLLVGSDIERGVGQQVQGYTIFPHAMALARHDRSIDLFAASTVRKARDVGIHIAFAPVADVATNPLNPIISIRAFSEDTERAARATAQFVKLAEESGLLTTAKHFPGHGDTHQDSHDSLPVVSKTLDELRQCELRPFQAAVDAGCSLVMTAHVAFPRIDSSGLPATLSPVLIRKLLRDEMGFDGAVCSDSLLMAGVRDLFGSEGQMALATLNAGVDVLLDVRDPVEVVDHLVASIENGSLTEARVDEALARITALKQKAFGQQPPVPLRTEKKIVRIGFPKPPGPPFDRNDPETIRWAQKIADQVNVLTGAAANVAAADALEVLGNSGHNPLPFNSDVPLAAILLKPFETAIDPPEQPLASALRETFRKSEYMQLGPNADASTYDAATEMARDADQLLIAMIVRPAAWHAFGLLPAQKDFVQRITRQRNDVVLASLGVPYALDDFPGAALRLCTYSDVPVSQQALADFLIQGTEPTAKQ
jgi:beta-glucosidase-like glycosyl hydrolase